MWRISCGRQQAPDPVSRNLGIIASGRVAPHYRVASFGTTKAHAAKVGLTEVSEATGQCSDEAGGTDTRETQLALKIMPARRTGRSRSTHATVRFSGSRKLAFIARPHVSTAGA